MIFDMSLIIDYIVPDSPSDFGAILFWILMIILVTIGIVDLRLYLDYRKTSKYTEKPQQKFKTAEKMKKSQEEKIQNIIEIRNKVDKILETNKL